MVRPAFEAFPKIPRLKRTVIVTEKIDGTNAQIHITADGEVYAGSRNRWITPEDDNFGFACWVKKYEQGLKEILGPGTHFGEWWGAGIGRKYGLLDKRFSLFNCERWKHIVGPEHATHIQAKAPGIGVVPKLVVAEMSDMSPVETALNILRTEGSRAAPGFMKPEGVVVYMTASGTMHKVLLEHDEVPKGLHGLPKGLVPKAEKDLQFRSGLVG